MWVTWVWVRCWPCLLQFVACRARYDGLQVAVESGLGDECAAGGGEGCALNILQRRSTKVPGEVLAESIDPTLVFVESSSREDWSIFSHKSCSHPINCFNEQLGSVKFLASEGLFYEFQTEEGDTVLQSEIEGRSYWADETISFPLASSSKLFTAFATMVTMQKKPKDWYPEKYVNEFVGWEDFGNFKIAHSHKRANLTIHQLLTHTSGLPFAMRDSKEDLMKTKLFYEPGTGFGYTLGHRVLGWMLRDYWKEQPETRHLNIETVNDAFKWLIYEPLELSGATHFDDTLTEVRHVLAFGYSGQAGDASIRSNAVDYAKLAVIALRRGKLMNGKHIISENNWNRWAVPNLLPGGKLSQDLVHWQGVDATWANFNFGGLKESIMRQSGAYGWNYFGATYYDSKEIGWCGFFSSCLRVTYQHDLAFVMTQRDVSDLKKSKPYLTQHFQEMAGSLRCEGTPKCTPRGSPSVFCQRDGQVKLLSDDKFCPWRLQRGRGWGDDHKNIKFKIEHHKCYIPFCH